MSLGPGRRGRNNNQSSANGLVWRAITDNIGRPGHDDEWISVTDLDRQRLASHPWSLSGGGASSLLAELNSNKSRLSDLSPSIGRTTVVGEDDGWFTTASRARSLGQLDQVRKIVIGENVRDYGLRGEALIWWPYEDVFKPSWIPESHPVVKNGLWPLRSILSQRVIFGQSLAERKRPWYDHLECYTSKMLTPLSIAFAFVATHNHFVLDRGGKVFKQSAPVIKLPEGASEDNHLALLGVLNSSTVCFWLKQNSHRKASAGMGGGMIDQPWSWNYEFTGTTLQDLPLPLVLPLNRGRELDKLGQSMYATSASSVVNSGLPSASTMSDAAHKTQTIHGQLVATQEELDWETYRSYGLVDDDLTYAGESLPGVELGQRAFEIAIARHISAGTEDSKWFTRHGSTPVSVIPADWPDDYRELVQRRLDTIEANPNIRLLETPEYKRRWAAEPWEKQQEQALRGWLLDRLEDRSYWFDAHDRPFPRSISQVADMVSRDADLVSVLALWDRSVDVDVTKALTKLLTDEAVPYLAAQRLKDSGLRKREAWEETWELQRREDNGEDVGKIPVPPKYATADFRKASWWQARGKLDVPKERFILYPEAGRSTDPTLLLGWAGWDYAQQFLVLATIMDERISEGADDGQLVPLAAGMAEVLPWVKQWHADLDPTFGMSMADFCSAQLEERMIQVSVSTTDLKAWRPAPATRGRRAIKENA